MKIKHIVLISILSLFTILSACSNSSSSKPVKTDSKKQSSVERTDLILATTTSTQDSGLLDVLLPEFEKNYPYHVKTVAVGTGQALEMGTRGEADVLLVHAPAAEEKIVESGDAINRQKVMYNDFILVGPSNDPSKIKGLTVPEALKQISTGITPFISRGDDSGTHKKELELWKQASIDPSSLKAYVETGQGMGNTLQIAAEKEGYTLTDRATFLSQKKNLGDFDILVEGDDSLLNIYHVMQVNPDKHDKLNSDGAKAFIEFMTDKDTQDIIKAFGVDQYGEPLFFLFEE